MAHTTSTLALERVSMGKARWPDGNSIGPVVVLPIGIAQVVLIDPQTRMLLGRTSTPPHIRPCTAADPGVDWNVEVVNGGLCFSFEGSFLALNQETLSVGKSQAAALIATPVSEVVPARSLGGDAIDPCCGHLRINKVQPIEFWEDLGHKNIAKWAFESIAALLEREPTLDNSFWLPAGMFKRGEFSEYFFAGLRDADYLTPYSDRYWESHFYDPDLGSNYHTTVNIHRYNPTAYTEACWHGELAALELTRAVALVNGGSLSVMGEKVAHQGAYRLGLAMHYLTDLSQPMHAALVTNFPGEHRHTAFERFFDALLREDPRRFRIDIQSSAQIDPGPGQHFGPLVHSLAVLSKRTYNEELKSIYDTKPKDDKNSNWSEADSIIQECAQRGQIIAATFIRAVFRRLHLWRDSIQADLPDVSHAPAWVAAFEKKYLAWVSDSHELRIATTDSSPRRGQSSVIVATDCRPQSPALVLNSDLLWAFWLTSSGVARFSTSPDGSSWSTPRDLGVNAVPMDVCAASDGAYVHVLAYGNRSATQQTGLWHLQLNSDRFKPARFPNLVSTDRPKSAPSVAALGSRVYGAWAGPQHSLVTTVLSPAREAEDVDNNTRFGELSSPKLAVMAGELILVYTKDQHLCWAKFDEGRMKWLPSVRVTAKVESLVSTSLSTSHADGYLSVFYRATDPATQRPAMYRACYGTTGKLSTERWPVDLNDHLIGLEDRTLARPKNRIHTYVICGGAKFLIGAPQELVAMGDSWGLVHEVPEKELDLLSSVAYDKTVVRQGKDHYVFGGGTPFHFGSEAEYLDCGYAWAQARQIPPSVQLDLQRRPDEGTVFARYVNGRAVHYYKIAQQQLRQLTNPTATEVSEAIAIPLSALVDLLTKRKLPD